MDIRAWIRAQSIPTLHAPPLEHVMDACILPDGCVVECGVYRGTSIRKLATLGRATIGFDSFEGLPETWHRPDDGRFVKGFFAVDSLPEVPDNVTLVPGWFEDTLPAWTPPEQIALLHVDCDLYSSTRTVLESLETYFADGIVIVFDELVNYPGYEDHEAKALAEFLVRHPDWRLEWIGTHGPVNPQPERDNGYWDQPAAVRLYRRRC
jgi:Macrocin-O-methyltransferase (TylF)